MKNPVTFVLKHTDGSTRNIIIEPILRHDLTNTGAYKIFKTTIDNESALFTEQLEIDEDQPALADSDNPDYLGTITFTSNHEQWQYSGELLDINEQRQAAEKIISAH